MTMAPARILLSHGVLADGSSWSKVIPHLQAAGHEVITCQEPLTSLPDDINVVKTALKTLNDRSDVPIVVAGHSFGGFVITNAVTDAPNVKALVYVMAYAPDKGESVNSLSADYTPLESHKYFVPDAGGRLLLGQPEYVKYFAPDVNPVDARVLAASQGPFDGARWDFASGEPAWKQVNNKYYVIAEKDQIIQPELQAFFAKRMNAKTHTLKGASHAGLISRGEAVADIILEAANSS
ncbi:hypothetical protein JDV02_000165 [Purpureocillium takamizusanense]|uniref:AB hydrolase-1 domain-containing protein n=1 Tax=Purpureocillium takamizusanense TaxID=2060973 RepID=A0A9Q8V6K3_9HYPO|nr:uncharacterized protein JDV02_000165 [Purpureocillium takamizusanense]UNI13416.1 hypothetical protein JDV02_000165 [Purpureocillium takamizusanense]